MNEGLRERRDFESSLKRKRKLGRSREERMKGRGAMIERKDLKAKRKRKKKLEASGGCMDELEKEETSGYRLRKNGVKKGKMDERNGEKSRMIKRKKRERTGMKERN